MRYLLCTKTTEFANNKAIPLLRVIKENRLIQKAWDRLCGLFSFSSRKMNGWKGSGRKGRSPHSSWNRMSGPFTCQSKRKNQDLSLSTLHPGLPIQHSCHYKKVIVRGLREREREGVLLLKGRKKSRVKQNFKVREKKIFKKSDMLPEQYFLLRKCYNRLVRNIHLIYWKLVTLNSHILIALKGIFLNFNCIICSFVLGYSELELN